MRRTGGGLTFDFVGGSQVGRIYTTADIDAKPKSANASGRVVRISRSDGILEGVRKVSMPLGKEKLVTGPATSESGSRTAGEVPRVKRFLKLAR